MYMRRRRNLAARKKIRDEEDVVRRIQAGRNNEHLSPSEKKAVDRDLKKIAAGDTSDFVRWKQAKKKMELKT